VKIHGARLEVRRLSKAFGGGRVVDDVSFSVEGGRFLTLLGPAPISIAALLP
jgi:ABC-type Fe3+/spermidine/putrescine transport system ATPase subunit